MAPRRESFGLDHKVIQTLKLGRLTGVSRIPVVAGDSISFSTSMFVRMNNLRRAVPFDLRTDIYGFFVPYRFTYPTLYQALQAGRDANAGEAPHTNINNAGVQCLLMNNSAGASVPEHLLADYVSIFNHYFKDPHDADMVESALNPVANATDEQLVTARFGALCGALKTMHTTALQAPGVTEGKIPITVEDAASNQYSLDVSQLPRASAEWRDGQWRDWTAVRYEELHKQYFGIESPASQNVRPYYLGCKKDWMSSTDIDGTAGDQFGSVVGKLVGSARFRIPRRFMREHGTLWVLMVVRPSPVFTYARQYLDNPSNFRDYKKLWSVPEARKELPIDWTLEEAFWDGAANTRLGAIPFNQWYRAHPSYASSLLSEEDQGWEGRPSPTSGRSSGYVQNYDDVFATLRGGHGKFFALNRVMVNRIVGDVIESVVPRV